MIITIPGAGATVTEVKSSCECWLPAPECAEHRPAWVLDTQDWAANAWQPADGPPTPLPDPLAWLVWQVVEAAHGPSAVHRRHHKGRQHAVPDQPLGAVAHVPGVALQSWGCGDVGLGVGGGGGL